MKRHILERFASFLLEITTLQAQIDDMVYKLYGIDEEEKKVIEKG